jgi:hypothetical protein
MIHMTIELVKCERCLLDHYPNQLHRVESEGFEWLICQKCITNLVHLVADPNLVHLVADPINLAGMVMQSLPLEQQVEIWKERAKLYASNRFEEGEG